MRGLYVHVPFCRRRCIYCDFYTVGERLAVWPDYVDAVIRESETRIRCHYGRGDGEGCDDRYTLYIGGGTPSLMPDEEFIRLAAYFNQRFGTPSEFTIEVNPDDVSDEKATMWRSAGVDRVSMGVQSLVDAELKAIGRRHDSAQARRASDILKRHFDNISLDIMFGLPGQTRDSLIESVEGIIGMDPQHVSAYSLMYEERTALTALRDSGRLAETPEEDSAAMFSDLSERLSLAGFERYEISNYARPGYRSKHNSAYWRGVPYIGLGPGAHSYDGSNRRSANVPDLKKYIDFWTHYESCDGLAEDMPVETEILSADELREEMIMTRMRTCEGLPLDEYGQRFGEQALRDIRRVARRWIDDGCLAVSGDNSLVLTGKGIMISDEIIVSLF